MKQLSRYVAALSTAFCLVALPATAASGGSGLAELAGGPAGISFIIANGNYDGVTVTVNGPDGLSLSDTFDAGAAPVFSLFDEAGNVLPDGTYSYELRALPRLDTGLRGELEAARAAGDTGAAARLRAAGQLPDTASLVQSGHFSIVDGSIIVPDPNAIEKSADDNDNGVPNKATTDIPNKAQVFTTDLIVQGSECVGLDCTSSESFGFDTLRLKENNLRIKFDDTSGSASFPNNDWQITANDSTNGGANKFSIDDITGGKTPFTLIAGAPNNSLYVDSAGKVGIGTGSPVVNAHIAEGNTPTLRLEQDGSDGFASQTWDIAGNEANFFIRDVNNGSKLPFRIKPGAPDDSIYVDAAGDVGIGTDSPGQKLEVLNGGMQVKRDDGGQSSLFITSTGGTTDVSYILRANPSLNGVGGFSVTESGVSPFKIEKGALADTLVVKTNGVSMSGTVTVTGTLTVNGTNVPDYVFEPDFPIESIEEHASFMWANKHLPAVEPASYDAEGQARIDLGANQLGMLEELEKAHVYIDQLNNELKDKDQKLADLEQRLASLEALIN